MYKQQHNKMEHIKITKELRSIQYNKFKKLFKFIENNSKLAEQGSPEWLAMRKKIIGGSELSTILGKNPFNKIQDLVADKIGLTKFYGNTATRWGNLFEELSRIIIEIILIDRQGQMESEHCSGNNQNKLPEYGIFETGSLEGAIPHHRFSPDGLSVFLYKVNQSLNEANQSLYIKKKVLQFLITLLEFKSPLRSIPTGSVPEYYAPQIQAGLCDINMSEIGLFVNNMYRKCSISDLGLSIKYDTVFHMSDLDIKKKFKPETPVAYGIIGFYQTLDQSNKFEAHIKKQTNSDYSNSNIDEFSDSLAKQAIITNIEYDTDTNSSDEDDSDADDEKWVYKNIDEKIKELKFKNKANSVDENIDKFLIDFGNESTNNMDILLKYIEMDFISVIYYKPNINMTKYAEYLPNELVNVTAFNDISSESNDNIELISYKMLKTNPMKFIKKFANTCNKNKYIPIGYLPWKLFKSDIIVVEKDPLYIYQFVDKIEEVIKIIEDINSFDETDDQIDRYKHYFPRAKINSY